MMSGEMLGFISFSPTYQAMRATRKFLNTLLATDRRISKQRKLQSWRHGDAETPFFC